MIDVLYAGNKMFQDGAFLTFINAQGETACTDLHPDYSNTEISITTFEPDVTLENSDVQTVVPPLQIVNLNLSVNEVCSGTVSIEESSYYFTIQISPNPSTGLFYIDFGENPVNASLSVFDAQGKLVKQLKLKDLRTQLNLSDQPPGLYLLQFVNESTVFTRRVVLK